MTDEEVRTAGEILRGLGIRFVIVGGQAVAQHAATTTRDVDVMVATADYAATVAALRDVKGLAFDWDDGKLCRFRLLSLGGVPLDIINGAAFSGDRPGRDFFEFLDSEASTQTGGIAYASPESVWYTRLLTKRWKVYAEKIVTNVIDGVPRSRLAGVEEIARRFGTEALVRERLTYVRAELVRPEVASLLPADRTS